MSEIVKDTTLYTPPIEGDPIAVQKYVLSNGMTLFLTINKDEPRVFTNIVFRVGSKYDPPETTGLAHYMEHLMFKGTSKIGALNWAEEQKDLAKISDLYEQYRVTKDTKQRAAIYKEIDEISGQAARWVAANEYDKLVSIIGAKSTNAYTWVEQTVYVNDIPSNELERWMDLESERFKMIVPRLFHTELETVFEEFNINQDKDFRKVSKEIRTTLFPSHPYGTQTTIGEGEHLKNPSLVNIQQFYEAYYTPNNMAIVLSGDLDPEQTITWAEQYFGTYPNRPSKPFEYEPQPALEQVVRKTVYGNESGYVALAWRFEGGKSADVLPLTLLKSILQNKKAGLIDLNLNQQQLLLEAESWLWIHEDYSILGCYGKPRDGQTFEEVEALLVGEIEKIAKGDFDTKLLEAVKRNYKLSEIRAFETNSGRVGAISNAFILGIDWERVLNGKQEILELSKEDIMAFAAKYLRKDNYVAIYKHQGTDENVMKVDKPPITPIQLNRTEESPFAKQLMTKQTPIIAPQFVDYQKTIQTHEIKQGVHLDYIQNKANELFKLYYIFEMGKDNDRKNPIALKYLDYLGTSKYTSDELRRAFYALGIQFSAYCMNTRMYISITGLEESLEEGVILLEHLLQDAQPNQKALDNVVADILTRRQNNKKDKRIILREGLVNFAKYGHLSPFTDLLSVEQLKALDGRRMTLKIKQLYQFEHRIFYYGTKPVEEVIDLMQKQHRMAEVSRPVLPAKIYPELPTREPQIIFVDFPSVQIDLVLLSRGATAFDEEAYILSNWYNTYFGIGLSSVVFQEIRESQALAYATYAYYSTPTLKDTSHYLMAYVGTQPDKMVAAVSSMNKLLNEMPMYPKQLENARLSILRKMESERITKDKIYWQARQHRVWGYDQDIRQQKYERLQAATSDDLASFYQKYIKNKAYKYLLLGDKRKIDFDYLKQIAQVKELSIDDLFGY